MSKTLLEEALQTLDCSTREAFKLATTSPSLEGGDSLQPDASRKLVLDRVRDTLRHCAIEHNSVAPTTACLPDELLVEIFAFLPMRGRLSTSAVCESWRNVSLGNRRRLWSVIEDVEIEGLSALLDRAHGIPVSVHLRIDLQEESEIPDELGRHMDHIQKLDLVINELNWDWIENWRSLFECAAPMLRSFSLELDRTRNNHLELQHAIFGGKAPLLRVLHFINVGYEPSSCLQPAFSKLIQRSESYGLFSKDTLSRLFRSSPLVQSLRIEIIETDGSFKVTSPIVPPASLRKLVVVSHRYETNHKRIFKAIDHARIPIICLDDTWETDSSFDVIPVLCNAEIHSAVLHFCKSGIDVRFVDVVGNVRQFQSLQLYPGILEKLATILSTISELTLLGDLRYIPEEAEISCTALRTLNVIDQVTQPRTIECARESFEYDKPGHLEFWYGGGSLLPQGTHWNGLKCNKVETVRFSVTNYDPLMSLSHEDIARFVHSLSNDQRKVGTLELHACEGRTIDSIEFMDVAEKVAMYRRPLEVLWENEVGFEFV